MEIKPKPKHFEIKTINWVLDKKEVSCNKIIPTFLPAEFICSKIDRNTNSIYTPENAKNGLNSFVRFLAWITEKGLS